MPNTDLQNKTKEELLIEIYQLKEYILKLEGSSKFQTLPDQILINYQDYLSILEEESDAIFKGNKDGQIIFSNKSASVITGYNNDELKEMSFEQFFSEEELIENPLKYDDVLKGKIVNKKRKLIKKDNNNISVEMSTKFLKDGTIICTMRDITSRVLLETALLESENRYKLAIEATEDGIWDWNKNTEVAFYSDKWKSLLGYLPDELPNTFSIWIELLHPDDKDRMEAEIEKYLDNPSGKFEGIFRLKHKDGTYRWIKSKAASVLDENGEVIRMFGIHTDITKEIKTNQELVENEKKYRSLFEALPYGGEVLDTKGIIKDVSPGTVKLLGYKSEEIIGEHISNFIDKRDLNKFKDKFPKVLQGLKQEGEIRLVRKDGETKHVLRAGQPLYDDEGKINSVLILTVDINERKLIEKTLLEKNQEIENRNLELNNTERQLLALNEELIYAKEKADESNRLKTAFLANMSHEIRTPMNGILGFSQLLMMPDIDDKKIKEYTKIIMQSGRHLLNIINDIIDIAKIDSGQLQIHKSPVSLNRVFKELYSFFHSFKTGKNKENIDLKVNLQLSDKESVILTDETRLRQILSNLINNAVKFTEEGSVEFGYKIENETVVIYVKDTGIGINKEKVDLIFSRFMQAAVNTEKLYGGTGLGLAISKACVKLLGGQIWVESVPGKGSTFYFSLPLVKAQKDKPKQNEKSKANFSGQKILIVEDDHVNFEYFKEIISKYDINIKHVETADDAINAVKEDDFDLILMDIQLPGKDGNYAIKEIKKIKSKIPIIAQSAYAFENEKQKSFEAGCDHYITKPVQHEEFIKTISSFLK